MSFFFNSEVSFFNFSHKVLAQLFAEDIKINSTIIALVKFHMNYQELEWMSNPLKNHAMIHRKFIVGENSTKNCTSTGTIWE